MLPVVAIGAYMPSVQVIGAVGGAIGGGLIGLGAAIGGGMLTGFGFGGGMDIERAAVQEVKKAVTPDPEPEPDANPDTVTVDNDASSRRVPRSAIEQKVKRFF